MRGSSEHIGSDIGVIVVAIWMLVAGAWIALSGGFAITAALVLSGIVAGIASLTVLGYLERHRDRSARVRGFPMRGSK